MADTNKYRLLVVDDNPAIHEDFKKILNPDIPSENNQLEQLENQLFGAKTPKKMPFSYNIDSASDGLMALLMVQQAIVEDKPYIVVFMDVLMPPGIDGVETTRRIWQTDPDIQIVLCTAYSDYSWDEMTEKLGFNDNFLILKKPFDNIEIRQITCCLTQKWLLSQQAGHRFDRLSDEVLKTADDIRTRLHYPSAL